MLDNVFELLETATKLEKSNQRIEAATKYYEAVYLMKQILQHTPNTRQSMQTRNLLEEKIALYSDTASRLYFDDSSVEMPVVCSRSPTLVNQQQFFVDNITTQRSQANSPRNITRRNTELTVVTKRANTKFSSAIKLDEKGQAKEASEKYISAAEEYLGAIRLCEQHDPNASSVTSVLKRRLEGILDRVGQLKNPKKQISNQQKRKDVTSSYSKEEIAVLKRSSLIASGVFLPWCNKEALQLSNRVVKAIQPVVLFKDPEGDLALSEKQLKRFHRWARPNKIVQLRKQMGLKQQPPVMIRSVNPYSIRQQYVTDCSFIASLCICAAFEKRFRKPLITSIIYPQKDGIPIYNPEGKYMVKLWLNGVTRQVIVDDRIPIDKNSNLLCSETSGNRNQLELWVTIIEKAYMKLCGGYNFPGSNSGIDLQSLTGWIPERIFFAKDPTKIRDFETPSERAWDRLFSACSFGDCLITVSTSRGISEAQAEELGLVTGHAYAVLDIFQSKDGIRLLQLKNPWASKGWKGKYSCYDRVSWENNGLQAEVGYNAELAAKHDDGIFWISWEDVVVYFQNVQLSWNPALFSYSVTTHSLWPKDQGPTSDIFNIGENPQYILTLSPEAVSKKAPVWVLISRHVTKQEQEGCKVNDFLTIHMARNTERKEVIWYPHGPDSLVNGVYSNNPSILSRYDVSGPEDKFISLILSQHQKSQDMGYTLSCYCTEPFTLGRPKKELPYLREVPGSWGSETAGGPVGKDGFFRNPVHLIVLGKRTAMQIRCSAEKSLAVNVMLIAVPQNESNDYRRQARKRGRPVLDSGSYMHGFAVTETKEIEAGLYVLVVSAYNKGQTGVYHLKIASSLPPTIQSVP